MKQLTDRVNAKKIFGIHFDENLSWSYHVNNVIQSSYETLRSLRQFKRFAPYKARKSLAETLIISKIRLISKIRYQFIVNYQSIKFNDYKKLDRSKKMI